MLGYSEFGNLPGPDYSCRNLGHYSGLYKCFQIAGDAVLKAKDVPHRSHGDWLPKSTSPGAL